MERRLFVKQAAMLSTFALVSTPSFLKAKESSTNSADVSSAFLAGKKVMVTGFAYDSRTQQEVDAVIEVSTRKGIFSKTKEIVSVGGYSILGSIQKGETQKVKVRVQAEGYKTLQGHLYFTSQGCRIHSDMWHYNPDFKPEFIPKNEITASEILSRFSFYLVKA